MDLCNLTGKFINIFYDYYKFINMDKTINITKMGEDYIILDRTLEVFAIKLEGDSNYQLNLNGIEQLRSAYMFSEEKVRIMVTIVKTETYQGSYLFCTNRDLAISLKDMFKSELLGSDKIVNALFDSYLINDYYINDEKRFSSTLSTNMDKEFFEEELEINTKKELIPIEWDLLYYKGKEIMKEAVDAIEENYNIYQSWNFKQKKEIIFAKLYRTNWNGAIHIYFDLSYKNVLGLTRNYKNKTKDEGGNSYLYAKKLHEAVEKKDVDVCLANSILILKDSRDMANIANQLGIEYIKKSIGTRDILLKTLLNKRNPQMNSVIRIKDIERFVAKVHKKDSITEIEGRKVDIDFYGYDINGAYVNYVFRMNTNPHAIMIASSGSGKSFSIQKIITQIIEYDAIENFSKKIEDKQIRYFDVDFSAQKLITELQVKHNYLIDEISPTLSDMRFNLIDIKISESGKGLDLGDLTFKLTILDLALECNNSDKLTAEEYSLIKEAITELYVANSYERVSLYQLREKGFNTLVLKLQELGYSEYVTIDDIKEEHAHLVQMLKKPTLNNLQTLLSTKSKNSSISENMKITIDGALGKVSAINSLEVFSKHPIYEFGTNNFVYFDVGNIKADERLFAPIYMYVLMSYYNYDKEQALDIRLKRKKRKFKEIPQTYYIIEEAHNFMRYQSFKKTFDILAREARKHGVHMIFVTQNIEDIPKSTIASIATRIYMAEQEKKADMLSSIKKHIGTSKELEWTFMHTMPYQMLVEYDKGVFGCKFDITEKETELFSTSA